MDFCPSVLDQECISWPLLVVREVKEMGFNSPNLCNAGGEGRRGRSGAGLAGQEHLPCLLPFHLRNVIIHLRSVCELPGETFVFAALRCSCVLSE